MSINKHSNESKRTHSDSLINIGDTIHIAVIAGLFNFSSIVINKTAI